MSMTENEIKEFVADTRRKAEIFRNSGFATAGVATVFDKSADIIEELLEYKAIGTVEEFKNAKRSVHIADMAVEHIEKGKQEIRAKAIDEFAEVIRGIHYNYPIGTDADTNEPLYAHEDGTWHNLLNDATEQMKGGAK